MGTKNGIKNGKNQGVSPSGMLMRQTAAMESISKKIPLERSNQVLEPYRAATTSCRAAVSRVSKGTTFLRNSIMPGRGKPFMLKVIYTLNPRIGENPIIDPIVHIGVPEIKDGEPKVHGQCFCKGKGQPPGDGRYTDDNKSSFK